RDWSSDVCSSDLDHVIPDEPKFLQVVALGVQVAQAGKLVTFGITPTRPETGYGYIKAAGRRPLLAQGGLKALAVARFVEKPDLPTAKRYLRAGGFYWNSGIFVWRANPILGAMATPLPKLARRLKQLVPAARTPHD